MFVFIRLYAKRRAWESNCTSLTLKKQGSNEISNIACREMRRECNNPEKSLEKEQLTNLILAWPSLPLNVRQAILLLARQ